MKRTSRIEGFSLVEMLTVLAVLATSLTLAVPSWNEARSQRQFTNASEQLSLFLSSGRSQAVKSNQDIAVSLVYRSANEWCVGMSDGGFSCDCTVEDSRNDDYCAVGGVPQVLHGDEFSGTEMDSYADDPTFVFDRVRGTLISADVSQPHFFNLRSANGQLGLQVGISPTGNTFICRWLESTNLTAYRSCEPAWERDPASSDGALKSG
jgi:prepilin-type N-terminal cleavage/methylation domain-containing protein